MACFLNTRQEREYEDIDGRWLKEWCKLDIRKYAFSQRTVMNGIDCQGNVLLV